MTRQDETTEQDDRFMGEAIAEARLAGLAGNVPVGAVVVLDGRIIGRGRNRRRSSGDPTAHAEIEALREAAGALGGWRVEATLYVTQEPCPMCAGAVVNARVRRLVFGCANPKAGAVVTLFEIPTDPRLNHRVMVNAGIRGAECGELLTSFFEELRRKRRATRAESREDDPIPE